MKRIIAITTAMMLLFAALPVNTYGKDSAISVSADSAVLMDAETGQILYSKGMDTAYPPASTTKIMTVLLTLERCNLDDVVKVGKIPPTADGSKIYIYEGEELKVKDLLYAVLLVSANDCAEALAEYISGSMDSFAKEMNERAKELGCTDANFVNPTGLYDKNHKASAKDLALILRELSKHPEFKQIATTLSYKIQPTNKCSKVRPLSNENRLIQKFSRFYYEGCEGGKTGYTVQSQHSYVSVATRNGQKLIVALVHDKSTSGFEDARNLFNYGFNNFHLVKLFSQGQQVSTYSKDNLNIPLYAADDFYYVKGKNDTEMPGYDIVNKSLNDISFKTGDNILEADVSYKGKDIGKVNLYSNVNHILGSKVNNQSRYSLPAYINLLLSASAAITIILAVSAVKVKKNRLKKLKNKGQ
jgi:D-alanyl-D-alanine carboxypeptidase